MTGVPFDPPRDSRKYVRLGSNRNNTAERLTTNATRPSISIAIIVVVLIFYDNINIKLSFTSSSAMAFVVRSEVYVVGTRTYIASATSSLFEGVDKTHTNADPIQRPRSQDVIAAAAAARAHRIQDTKTV